VCDPRRLVSSRPARKICLSAIISNRHPARRRRRARAFPDGSHATRRGGASINQMKPGGGALSG